MPTNNSGSAAKDPEFLSGAATGASKMDASFAIGVLESISDGFSVMDAQWRFIYINEPGLKILSPLRKTRENLLGRIIWEEMPQVLGTQVEENYRRAMREQVTIAFELYYAPIDRWLFVRVYPSKQGLSVYFLDIHERKQQEQKLTELSQQLLEQTEIFDTTLSHINDFAYIFNREGRFVFVNRALLDLWGLSLKDAVGKNFFDLNYPVELAGRLQREIEQVFETKTGITNVTPYTSPSGNEGYYEYIFRPVLSADGSVKRVAGSTRDISGHKSVEKALRESEERFRNLADNMGQFAWITDASGAISWYNRRWYDFTGTTPVDMMGWGWQAVHHPDHVERVTRKFKEHIARELDWEDVFPLRGRDGKYRWFLSRAFPIRDQAGKFLSWFGTNTDITELRAAREEAERASQAKDDFLAALSHELRTPLNPVLLIATEAAGNPDLTPEVRGDFETIVKNVTLEAQLIDDLLDLTRITHGKLALSVRQIDLHTVIRDAIQTVAAEIAEKAIILTVDLAAAWPAVMGDAVRLQQVFWNIIRNAVKFTPSGGKVRVASMVNPAKKQLEIRIEDSGIGMTADELGRLFNAFAQGDHAGPTGSHRFGGLGLGLAISRAIVELHSGRISATSAGSQQGSVFLVELPLVAIDSANPFADRLKTPGHQRTMASQTRRILLVEDHAATRVTLSLLLRRRDYEVFPAGSLKEARELYEKQEFDLLVSDLGLQDGDGCTLMEEMRQRFGMTGIALTGYGMEDDADRCKRAGFATHLIKPVSIQSLDDALARLSGVN